MGGNLLTCQRQNDKKAQILVKQMQFYKWRQRNNNKFMPNVTLTCQSQLKQQQILRQFLDKCKRQESFSLNKLTHQIQQIAQNNQQILSFEKYACNLAEIDTVLQIEELLYLLKALLIAFEEIKKIFKTVLVERQCCFVTFQGEIRAWLNSNPKSNQLQTNKKYQYFAQRDYKQILSKIVALGKPAAIKNIKNHYFFVQLQKYIASLSLRNDIFEFTRNWLSQYSQKQRIPFATNIKSGLSRVKTLNILKFSKRKSLNKQSSNFTKDEGICNVSTNCMNTPRSSSIRIEINQNQCSTRFQKPKIRASDTTFASYSYLNQSNITVSPIYYANLPLSHTKTNSVEKQEGSHTARTYEEHRKIYQGSQVINRTQKPLLKEGKQQAETKKVQFKIDQKEDNIFDISQEQAGSLIEGNLLTSKQLTNKLTSANRRNVRHRRSDQQKRMINRRVSILDIDNSQQDSEIQKQNQRPTIHFHTFQQINSIPTITDIDRPWITSKTINRLIPNSLDEVDSLVHSVGTSSEYNGSEYGGALSIMGREISTRKRGNTSYLIKKS